MRKRAKISYRLLLLLAVVMAVVPINYYSVSSEFQNARTDAAVINAFGFIRGSVQRLVKLMPYEDVTPIIAEIDKRYIFISKNYLLLPANQSYFEACDFEPQYRKMLRCWSLFKERLEHEEQQQMLEQSEGCWELANEVTDIVQQIAEKKQEAFKKHFFIRFLIILSILLLLVYLVVFNVNRRLERDIMLDPLSGVNNRKFFREYVEHMVQDAKRYQRPLSLLFVDIDHFKRINDRFGHAFGDEVIKECAKTLGRTFRASDRIFRYGGEEFVVVIYNSDKEEVNQRAERFRERMEALRLEHPLVITVSAGITQFRDNEPIDVFVARADKAMYAAKRGGRNNIVLA